MTFAKSERRVIVYVEQSMSASQDLKSKMWLTRLIKTFNWSHQITLVSFDERVYPLMKITSSSKSDRKRLFDRIWQMQSTGLVTDFEQPLGHLLETKSSEPIDLAVIISNGNQKIWDEKLGYLSSRVLFDSRYSDLNDKYRLLRSKGKKESEIYQELSPQYKKRNRFLIKKHLNQVKSKLAGRVIVLDVSGKSETLERWSKLQASHYLPAAGGSSKFSIAHQEQLEKLKEKVRQVASISSLSWRFVAVWTSICILVGFFVHGIFIEKSSSKLPTPPNRPMEAASVNEVQKQVPEKSAAVHEMPKPAGQDDGVKAALRSLRKNITSTKVKEVCEKSDNVLVMLKEDKKAPAKQQGEQTVDPIRPAMAAGPMTANQMPPKDNEQVANMSNVTNIANLAAKAKDAHAGNFSNATTIEPEGLAPTLANGLLIVEHDFEEPQEVAPTKPKVAPVQQKVAKRPVQKVNHTPKKSSFIQPTAHSDDYVDDEKILQNLIADVETNGIKVSDSSPQVAEDNPQERDLEALKNTILRFGVDD